jgi:catechol 2,3-dioxygenase-like lactoylglutathione lyase family enzyme
MPHFKKLTPNLLVTSVERSLDFYTEVLGFERGMTVPEDSPLVFAQVTSGAVEIFLNDVAGAVKEYPVLGGKPLGTSGTMFVEVEGIRELHAELAPKVTIVMPLITQWYGMMEFVIADPDGYLITFAERVP